MATTSKEDLHSSSSSKTLEDFNARKKTSGSVKDGEMESTSNNSREGGESTPQTSIENNRAEVGSSSSRQPQEAVKVMQSMGQPFESVLATPYRTTKVEETPSVLQSGASRKRAKVRQQATAEGDLPMRFGGMARQRSRDSSEPARTLSSSDSGGNVQTSGDDRGGDEEGDASRQTSSSAISNMRMRRHDVVGHNESKVKNVPPFAISSEGQGGSSNSNWDTGNDIREQNTIRKQNSACDACRSRKVRCNRMAGEDRCAHCKSKGINCTTHFVQSAALGGKRTPKKQQHLPSLGVVSSERLTGPSTIAPTRTLGTDDLIKYLLLREVDYANVVKGLSYPPSKVRPPPISTAEARLFQSAIRQNFVIDLVETYFAIVHTRYPIMDPVEFRKRFDHPSIENGGPPADVLVAVVLAWGAKFSEHPIILSDRREAVHELTPLQRTKREAATNSSSMAEVAVANPVQIHDRGKSRLSGSIVGRSRIAEDLVVKAQEVLDRNKVHRVPSMDHIRAALIVEALFWKPAYNLSHHITSNNRASRRALARPGLYVAEGNWVTSAIWHLKKLQVHHQESIDGVTDPMQRTLIGMCWWLACMMDAHMCAFYRRKPLLSKDDYTTESPAPPPAPEQEGPHPLGSETAYRVWINSATDQVEMMRMVCHTLWTPRAMREGVQAAQLEKLASMAIAWREQHLGYVGAPSPSWPPQWNFADAVTACSTDMNYHVVWILMWEAVEEFGIVGLTNAGDTSSTYNLNSLQIAGTSPSSPSSATYPGSTMAQREIDLNQIRNLRGKIMEEALNAALRTANLSQVLCDNGYLRLEPGIMKWTMNEAGYCLTRFRRREVLSIIDALRQYGQAFEECYEQANELEKTAGEYLRFEPSQTMVPSLVPTGVPSYAEEYVPKPAPSAAFPYQRQGAVAVQTPLSSSPVHPSYPHQHTGTGPLHLYSQAPSSSASGGSYSTPASSMRQSVSSYNHSGNSQDGPYPNYDSPFQYQHPQTIQARPPASLQQQQQQQQQHQYPHQEQPQPSSAYSAAFRDGPRGARPVSDTYFH